MILYKKDVIDKLSEKTGLYKKDIKAMLVALNELVYEEMDNDRQKNDWSTKHIYTYCR